MPSERLARKKRDLTLKRDCVRIFSTYSSVGIRSLSPPNGARSTFTKPFFSRTLRLPLRRQPDAAPARRQAAHQTAFIIRRLIE